jgi:hypothetical protein
VRRTRTYKENLVAQEVGVAWEAVRLGHCLSWEKGEVSRIVCCEIFGCGGLVVRLASLGMRETCSSVLDLYEGLGLCAGPASEQ